MIELVIWKMGKIHMPLLLDVFLRAARKEGKMGSSRVPFYVWFLFFLFISKRKTGCTSLFRRYICTYLMAKYFSQNEDRIFWRFNNSRVGYALVNLSPDLEMTNRTTSKAFHSRVRYRHNLKGRQLIMLFEIPELLDQLAGVKIIKCYWKDERWTWCDVEPTWHLKNRS